MDYAHGCCSHVACIIYYLSYAKYQTNRHPAANLSQLFYDSGPIYNESDSESEEEDWSQSKKLMGAGTSFWEESALVFTFFLMGAGTFYGKSPHQK